LKSVDIGKSVNIGISWVGYLSNSKIGQVAREHYVCLINNNLS